MPDPLEVTNLKAKLHLNSNQSKSHNPVRNRFNNSNKLNRQKLEALEQVVVSIKDFNSKRTETTYWISLNITTSENSKPNPLKDCWESKWKTKSNNNNK